VFCDVSQVRVLKPASRGTGPGGKGKGKYTGGEVTGSVGKGTASVPRRYRVGTASVPRCYKQGYGPRRRIAVSGGIGQQQLGAAEAPRGVRQLQGQFGGDGAAALRRAAAGSVLQRDATWCDEMRHIVRPCEL
jgi:hypothetical protein